MMASLQEGAQSFQHFMGARHNYIPEMGWETEMAAGIGLSLDQTRFMLALLVSIPMAEVVRRIHSTTVRHFFSAVVGFLLVYYPFGFGTIHAVAPSVMVYLGMVLAPSQCGTIAWSTCFPYLIYLHVVNASGANWQMGLLDFTGCEMVLVLKLITIAVARQDHWLMTKKDKQLSDYQNQVAVDASPSPLQYLSYVFGLGNLLAGPYLEYVDYRDFMEGRGLWDGKKPVPRPWAYIAQCMFRACFYMALYQMLNPVWNGDLLKSAWYANAGFWMRWWTCFVCSFTCQVKFVFAWKISEASLSWAGLNLIGWDDKTGRPKWGRYENVRFETMLLSDSARVVVSHWNIGTARFLRRYVYERLTPVGQAWLRPAHGHAAG